MRSHFLRFYLLIFITAGLFIFSFGHLSSALVSSPVDYTIEVQQVYDSQQIAQPARFERVEKSSVQLSSSLISEIEGGEIISYRLGNEIYYLRALNDSEYLQWGPIPVAEQQEADGVWLLMFFYSSLAIVFLLLLYPTFRDLSHLQKCAIEFGKAPQKQPLTISKKSSAYPLAYSLYTMSNRLLDFVEIHKDLARIIAHEVRTPLARMKFVIKRIESRVESKHIEQMKSDVVELETVAEEFLQFSTSHTMSDNYFSPIFLGQIQQELKTKYQHLDQNIEILVAAPKEQVDCHWPQLSLAMTNLINNALRYANSQVRVTLSVNEQQVLLAVEDDGAGFNSPPTKPNEGCTKGFGLGLYIVEKIVERHQGELACGQSDLGGAKVEIQIPQRAQL